VLCYAPKKRSDLKIIALHISLEVIPHVNSNREKIELCHAMPTQ
jgi:hypothetical protein